MEIRKNLTKDGFWNEMMAAYPKAAKKFCDWIDEYKKEVDWINLFNEHLNIKFHDIPYAMQYGIWVEYCRRNLGEYFEQPEHPSQFIDLEEDIKSVFKETDQLIEEGE